MMADGECSPPLAEDASSSSAQPLPPMVMRTIHAPLIRVSPFPAAASASDEGRVLTAAQAAALMVAILQYLLVQLQLTPGSWGELDDAKQQIEADALLSGRQLKTHARKYIQMMSSLDSAFASIMRVFIAPIGSASSHAAAEELARAYPHVEETLLVFGTSESSPLMVYRICLAYEQDTAPPSDSRREAEIVRALSRSVIRQLVNQTQTMFSEKQPPGMRSPNIRLRVFFRMRHHPDPSFRLTRELPPPTDQDDTSSHAADEEMSHDQAPLTSDYFAYTQLTFKPDYSPRLVSSFSSPVVPSRSDRSPAAVVQRKAASRAPKMRGCMPCTILVADASHRQRDTPSMQGTSVPQQEHESSDQPHEPVSSAAASSSPAAASPVWYQFTERLAFVRTFPPS